jgi:hypothetical protein
MFLFILPPQFTEKSLSNSNIIHGSDTNYLDKIGNHVERAYKFKFLP